MSVHRITSSEAASNDVRPMGEISFFRPDLVGYIFHLAWIYLLFYNPGPIATAIGGPPLPSDPAYMVSVIALVSTLGIGILRSRAFMKCTQSTLVLSIASIATAIGTVAYYLYSATSFSPFIVVGGVLTGCGSALLAVHWAAVFGNASPQAILANFGIIFAIIAGIAVTVHYISQPVWAMLLVALPLLSGGCLIYARQYQRNLGIAGHSQPAGSLIDRALSAKPSKRTAAFVGLAVAASIIGLTSGALLAFSRSDAGSFGIYGTLSDVVSAIFVTAFVGFLVAKNDWSHFLPAFVAPMVTLVAVLLPFQQYVAGGWDDVFYPVGSIAFELLFLYGVVLYARFADLSPARSFMIARGTYAISSALGVFGGEQIVSSIATDAGLQIASVVLFVTAELLVVILIACYFLSKRGPLAKKPSSDGPATSCSSEASEDPARPTHVADTADRCAVIAHRFGLSDSERDVLQLLASGKSTTAIQEELCIAPGTLNYHMRNIYAKSSVHSRQELLVLVMETSVDKMS